MTTVLLSALAGGLITGAGMFVWFVWYFKDVWK